MQFCLHIVGVDRIILKDLSQAFVIERGVYYRKGMNIGEPAEIVAGQYPALADCGRKGIDADPELKIGFLDLEKIARPDGAVPVFSQPRYQREAALVDAA